MQGISFRKNVFSLLKQSIKLLTLEMICSWCSLQDTHTFRAHVFGNDGQHLKCKQLVLKNETDKEKQTWIIDMQCMVVSPSCVEQRGWRSAWDQLWGLALSQHYQRRKNKQFPTFLIRFLAQFFLSRCISKIECNNVLYFRIILQVFE